MNAEFPLLDYFHSLFVQRGHRLNRGLDPCWLRFAFFYRGRDHARAQRLGKEESIAGLGAGIGEDSFGMDDAGNRVSELGFLIANAVAADHSASRLDHLRKTAGENALE